MTFDLTLPHNFFAQALGLKPSEQGAYFDRAHIVTRNSTVRDYNQLVESVFNELNNSTSGTPGNPIQINSGTANGMVAPKSTLGGLIMEVSPHAGHPNAFDELFFDGDFNPDEKDPDVLSKQPFLSRFDQELADDLDSAQAGISSKTPDEVRASYRADMKNFMDYVKLSMLSPDALDNLYAETGHRVPSLAFNGAKDLEFDGNTKFVEHLKELKANGTFSYEAIKNDPVFQTIANMRDGDADIPPRAMIAEFPESARYIFPDGEFAGSSKMQAEIIARAEYAKSYGFNPATNSNDVDKTGLRNLEARFDDPSFRQYVDSIAKALDELPEDTRKHVHHVSYFKDIYDGGCPGGFIGFSTCTISDERIRDLGMASAELAKDNPRFTSEFYKVFDLPNFGDLSLARQASVAGLVVSLFSLDADRELFLAENPEKGTADWAEVKLGEFVDALPVTAAFATGAIALASAGPIGVAGVVALGAVGAYIGLKDYFETVVATSKLDTGKGVYSPEYAELANAVLGFMDAFELGLFKLFDAAKNYVASLAPEISMASGQAVALQHQDDVWLLGSDDALLLGSDERTVALHSGAGEVYGNGGSDILVAWTPETINAGEIIGDSDQTASEDLNLEVYGGAGNDYIISFAGEKAELNGGEDNDFVFAIGGEEIDVIGGEGNDVLFNGSANGRIWGDTKGGDGEGGADRFLYNSGVFVQDADANDVLQWAILPLTGGFGYQGGETTLIQDWLMPWFQYGYTDSGQLVVSLGRLEDGESPESFLEHSMIIEDYDFAEDGGDLGLTFRIFDESDPVRNTAWLGFRQMQELTSERFNALNRFLYDAGFFPIDDPLILDLDGDGIETTRITQSVTQFDLDLDGFAERTAWVDADDGFLVLDRNGNGQIDDARELFGQRGLPGFAQLAELNDHDVDQLQITTDDSRFNELRVWRDFNQNGLSEDGELFTLDDLNIVSINLNAEELNLETPTGNVLLNRATFDDGDGEPNRIYEALFDSNTIFTRYNGQNGVKDWAESAPNQKGYGQLTDLAVAASNDPTIYELLISVQGSLDTPDLELMRESVKPLLQAWASAETESAELTAVRVSADGSLLDYAVFVPGSGGGHWELESGAAVLDGTGAVISQPKLEQITAQATTDGSTWRVEQIWTPTERAGASGDRVARPYLYTEAEDGSFQIIDYGVLDSDSTGTFWTLASGAAVLDGDGSSITRPTLSDVLEQVPQEGAQWTQEVFANANSSIAATNFAVRYVDGTIDDFTVLTSDAEGAFQIWASDLARGIDYEASAGPLSTYDFREHSIDLALLEATPGDTDTRKTVVVDQLDLHFATKSFGIEFQPDILIAGRNASGDMAYEFEFSEIMALVGGLVEHAENLANATAVRISIDGPLSSFFVDIDYDAELDSFTTTNVLELAPTFEQIFAQAEIEADGVSYLEDWRPVIEILLNDFDREDSKAASTAFLFQNIVAGYERSESTLDFENAAEALGLGKELVVTHAESDSSALGTDEEDFFYLSAGNQEILGKAGRDVYVVGENFGHDIIKDVEGPLDGANARDYARLSNFVQAVVDPNTPILPSSIDAVRFAHALESDVIAERDELDLILRVQGSEDTLRIENQFEGTLPSPVSGADVSDNTKIERVFFADGKMWDALDIAFEVSRPEDGGQVIIGTPEMDVLDGAGGNDFLYGGRGSDYYVFGLGYGHDEIDDSARLELVDNALNLFNVEKFIDLVAFGDGIESDNLRFSRVQGATDAGPSNGEFYDLRIEVLDSDGNATSDVLTIRNQFSHSPIEVFAFADGTTMDQSEVYARIVDEAGTSGADVIFGFGGSDVLRGLEGNDALFGGNGGDTYRFGRGDGFDVIKDSDNPFINATSDPNIILEAVTRILGGEPDSDIDELVFEAGISPEDIEFIRDADSPTVSLRVSGTEDGVVLHDQFHAESLAFFGMQRYNQIEEISFTDGSGTIWTPEQLARLIVADAATDGDDTLYGFSLNDRLDGGAGNDRLEGGAFHDLYVVRANEGSDTIYDDAPEQRFSISNFASFLAAVFGVELPDGYDSVYFENVNFEDVEFKRDAEDLIVRLTETNEEIRFEKQWQRFNNPANEQHHAIERFYFADPDHPGYAVEYNYKAFNPDKLPLIGTENDDTLIGTDFSETITGDRGDDLLIGASDGDVYIFDLTSGQDTIRDIQSSKNWFNDDIIRFGVGITQDDLNYAKVGEDLYISLQGRSDWGIRVEGHFASLLYGIERIEFTDPSAAGFLTLSDISAEIVAAFGTSGNDNFDEPIHEAISFNFLQGDDFAQGGRFGDTYAFGLGYDFDEIQEWVDSESASGAIDRVVFGELLTVDSMRLTRDGDDILFTIVENGDQLRIIDGLGERQIEEFSFAPSLDDPASEPQLLLLDDIRTLLLRGTEDDDILLAFDDVNDTLDGGLGSDLLQGLTGDDAYRFDIGYGDDAIIETGGSDTVVFGPGVEISDLSFERDGNTLIISIPEHGDSLAIIDGIDPDDDAGYVRTFEFANNQSLTLDEISQLLILSAATDGDDLITGYSTEPDILRGFKGNDYLRGSTGDDLYIYEFGDGIDVIEDSGGLDTISLIGISPDDLELKFIGIEGDLVIVLADGGEITIKEGQSFGAGDGSIESILFDDGVVWGGSEIEAHRTTGSATSGDDTLFGTIEVDTIIGGRGDDTIFGNAGPDLLTEEGQGFLTQDVYGISEGDGRDTLVIPESIGIEHRLEVDGVNRAGNWWVRRDLDENSVEFFFYDLIQDLDTNQVVISELDYRVNVIGQLNGHGVDHISFDDTVIAGINSQNLASRSHIRVRLEGVSHDSENNGLLLGSVNEDIILGSERDEQFISYSGPDVLIGGGGSDLYRFWFGDGHDKIYESEDHGTSTNDVIEIYGYDLSDAIFDLGLETDGTFSITFVGTDDRIDVFSEDSGSVGYGVERVRFHTIEADGTISVPTEVSIADLTVGLPAPVPIDQVFRNADANETIRDLPGSQAHTFDSGGGTDVFAARGNDTIEIKTYTLAQTSVVPDQHTPHSFWLVFGNGDDRILLDGSARSAVEFPTISFENGDLLTWETVHSTIQSKSTDDDDWIIGTDASDTFIPGLGDDFVDARGGDDVIIFRPGDGHDRIQSASTAGDILRIEDYSASEITIEETGTLLRLTFSGSDDVLDIVRANGDGEATEISVVLDDGTTWDSSMLSQLSRDAETRVANQDTFALENFDAASINLLENDVDPSGGTLSVIGVDTNGDQQTEAFTTSSTFEVTSDAGRIVDFAVHSDGTLSGKLRDGQAPLVADETDQIQFDYRISNGGQENVATVNVLLQQEANVPGAVAIAIIIDTSFASTISPFDPSNSIPNLHGLTGGFVDYLDVALLGVVDLAMELTSVGRGHEILAIMPENVDFASPTIEIAASELALANETGLSTVRDIFSSISQGTFSATIDFDSAFNRAADYLDGLDGIDDQAASSGESSEADGASNGFAHNQIIVFTGGYGVNPFDESIVSDPTGVVSDLQSGPLNTDIEILFTDWHESSNFPINDGQPGAVLWEYDSDGFVTSRSNSAFSIDEIMEEALVSGPLNSGGSAPLLPVALFTEGNDIVEHHALVAVYEPGRGDDLIYNTSNQQFGRNVDFVYRNGDGHDLLDADLVTNFSFVADFDEIVFGDLLRTDVTFTQRFGDIVLQIDEDAARSIEAGSITLFSGTEFSELRFSNDEVLSFEEVANISLLNAADDGNNHLIGYDFDNTMLGGRGQDVLFGGKGNDTYVYALGDGDDVFSERGGDGEDVVTILDYLPDEASIEFTREWAFITFGDGSDTLRLDVNIEEIVFDAAPHEVWNIQSLREAQAVVDQAPLVDAMLASPSDDAYSTPPETGVSQTLAGGEGDDVLSLGQGDVTVVYRRGDGSDRFRNLDDEGTKTLDLRGYLQSEVTVHRAGNSLSIELSEPGDRILVGGHFGNDGTSNGLDSIEFDDGAVWTSSDLRDFATTGTNEADFLQGFGSSASVPSDDTIIGLGGDDLLEGLYGADTYIFNAGDGDDFIREIGSDHDTLIIRGYTLSQAHFTRLANFDTTLIITFDGSDDRIRIKDAFANGMNGAIETIVLDDGEGGYVSLNFAEVQERVLLELVSDGEDSITGTSGNDTLTGGGGYDLLEGASGDDTYIYRRGDGVDELIEEGASFDTLRILDYEFSDVVSVRRSPADETRVVLQFTEQGDRVVIPFGLSTDERGIEQIEFASGGSLNKADLRELALNGATTDENDRVFGYSDLDDTLSGGLGDDTLSGGSGSDIYLYSRGDGVDQIDDNALEVGIDRIIISDFDPGMVAVERIYRGDDGVTLSFVDSPGDRLIIQNTLELDSSGIIEEIEFSDAPGGSIVWTRETLLNILENEAPTATIDAYFDAVIGNDTVISLDALLQNDFDADGDAIYVASVGAASLGSVVLEADAVRYTPPDDEIGVDSFEYTIVDGAGGASTTTVFLRIRPGAEARDDTGYSMEEDGTLQISEARLLANDIDGDLLSIDDLSDFVGGSAWRLGNGQIEFVADTGFFGPASFKYTATTDLGGSTTGTVIIQVTEFNDAPIAQDDSFSFDANEILMLDQYDLLANDIDPNNDRLRISNVVDDPNNGIVVEIDANEQIVIQSLPGFLGTETFGYEVEDDRGKTHFATVSVDVLRPNTSPITERDYYSTDEETPLLILVDDILSNDSDAENDSFDVISVYMADRNIFGTGLHGEVDLYDNGAIVFLPKTNYAGVTELTYEVEDEFGARSTGTIEISVAPINDSPVIDGPIRINAQENTPFSVQISDLLEFSRDPDVGDIVTLTAIDNPENLEFELVDGQVFVTPDANFVGEAFFDIIVEDSHGAIANGVVLVSVAGGPLTNPGPMDDVVYLTEDTPVQLSTNTILENDIVEGLAPPTIIGIREINLFGYEYPDFARNVQTRVTSDGLIEFIPVRNFNGSTILQYDVSYEDGTVASARIKVNVAAVNDAPETHDDYFKSGRGAPIVLSIEDIIGNDSDPFDTSHPNLELVSVVDPDGNLVDLYRGEWIALDPTPDASGVFEYTYTVADNGGLTTTGTIRGLFADHYETERYGTSGADLIIGSNANEIFASGAGYDEIQGRGGDDTLLGSEGFDRLFGGAGIDLVDYSESNTAVTVRLDSRIGQRGHANGDEYAGIENVLGSRFSDHLAGDSQSNELIGSFGDDELDGFLGADSLFGGDGDDSLNGGRDGDVLNGGDGNDTADYSRSTLGLLSGQQATQGVSISLATGSATGGDAEGDVLVGIENLIGSALDDLLEGDAGSNLLSGARGDDTIVGLDGDDTIVGGRGGDSLSGGEGFDTLVYENSAEAVSVDLSSDQASGGDALGDTISSFEAVIGSFHHDVLLGSSSANSLFGGYGDDTIVGDDGDDFIDGGAEDDLLTGGAGSDQFLITQNSGFDTVTDFEDGLDEIQLHNYDFSDVTISSVGADTHITVAPGVGVQLTDVDSADISEDDFVVITTNASDAPDGETTDPSDEPIDPTETAIDAVVGETITARLDVEGEKDWYRITLGEGESLRVSLRGVGADELTDPLLRIRDGNGEVVLQNDDTWFTFDLDSEVVFRAPSSGVYYVEVDSYISKYTGDYELELEQIAEPLYLRPGVSSGPLDAFVGHEGLRTDTPLQVYFSNAGDEFVSPNFGAYVSDGFTDFERNQIFSVFEGIETVADIEFEVTEVRAAADLAFVTADLNSEGLLGFFGFPTSNGTQQFGVLNNAVEYWNSEPGGALDDGGLLKYVAAHEIGHGLGLGHPHDRGHGTSTLSGVSDPYSLGTFELNQGVYSIMSYNAWFNGLEDFAPTRDFGFATGPMALDIAALQSLYGANDTYRTGNDVYVIDDENGPETGWHAIWDAGGVDELRYDGTRETTIDLRPATLRYEEGGGGFLSNAGGVFGGFTIAHDVQIENATGGSGNDALTGNNGANYLSGAAGDDSLFGLGGDDHLEGGAGIDTAVYSFNLVDYAFERVGDTLTVFGEGLDTLLSDIELLSFADQTIELIDAPINSTPVLADVPSVFAVDTSVADQRFVYDFDAFDSDGNPIIFGIHGEDASLFSIDVDGVLVALADFADLANSANGDRQYSLAVEATDGIASVTAEVQFSIGGDVTVVGGSDPETIVAGDTSDSIDGGAGDDVIVGGGGDDTIAGGSGADSVGGGPGIDTIDYQSSEVGIEINIDIGLGGSGDAEGDQVNGFENVSGSNFSDTIMGSNANNYLSGREGNDIIAGGIGNDVLVGGEGDDDLFGGAGDDVFRSGTGADTIDGGSGYDVVDFSPMGEAVTLDLSGNLANTGHASGDTFSSIESFIGTRYNDLLIGSSEAVTLSGGFGDDEIRADGGDSHLFGGAGDDEIHLGATSNNAYGGVGDDLLILDGTRNDYEFVADGAGSVVISEYSFFPGTDPNADTISGFERVRFADGELAMSEVMDAVPIANDDAYSIDEDGLVIENLMLNDRSFDGDDLIITHVNNQVAATSFSVTSVGGRIGQAIFAESGEYNFAFDPNGEFDPLNLGETDLVHLTYEISDGVHTDTANIEITVNGVSSGQVLIGDDDVDGLYGGSFDDTLYGNGGNDFLKGNAGDDTMFGGDGNDRFYVDQLGDVVVEEVNEGYDRVYTSVDYSLTENVEALNLQGADDLVVSGNDLVNWITANDGNNIVLGLEGNDRLQGRGGDDTLNGGTGGDVLEGQDGVDTFVFHANDGTDRIADFDTLGGEIIEFHVAGLSGFSDLTLIDTVHGALVRYDDDDPTSNQVTLTNVDTSELSSSHFVFT